MNRVNLHLYPSDFQNETRIYKITECLLEENLVDQVYLIGRGEKKKNLKPGLDLYLLGGKNYQQNIIIKSIRFIIWYFEIILNFMFKKIHLINAHSLSTLPVAILLKYLKLGKPIVIYDTHELETETLTMQGRRQAISKLFESSLIKLVKHVFVVSEPIEHWYKNEYDLKNVTTIINAPYYNTVSSNGYLRKVFDIGNEKLIFLYQGDLSRGRGIELILEAFQLEPDGACVVFLGNGTLENEIRNSNSYGHTVFHHDFVPFSDLMQVTSSADVGLVLIEPLSLSYSYCLPNKFFEYCHAGIPVLASKLVEMDRLIDKYDVGWASDFRSLTPEKLTQLISRISHSSIREKAKNTNILATEICWQKERKRLVDTYTSLIGLHDETT